MLLVFQLFGQTQAYSFSNKVERKTL